jgi:hypothetical protein
LIAALGAYCRATLGSAPAPFTPGRRRAAQAALVWAMAYTARCEHCHAPRPDAAPPRGSARAFLRAHAEDLLRAAA